MGSLHGSGINADNKINASHKIHSRNGVFVYTLLSSLQKGGSTRHQYSSHQQYVSLRTRIKFFIERYVMGSEKAFAGNIQNC